MKERTSSLPAPGPGFVLGSGVALRTLLFLFTLTFWSRGLWTLSLFQAGVFGLAIVWAARMVLRPFCLRGSVLLVPLAGTALWGLLQLASHRTVYRLATGNAVLDWTTCLVLFFLTLQVLAHPGTRRGFLDSLLWFGFAVSVLSVTQYFTSRGKIFWLFPTPYQDVLGPFVNQDHYSAFIELVLPLGVLEALRRRRNAVLYAGMAGVMFASVIAGASRAGSLLVTLEIAGLLLLALLRGLVSGRKLALTLAKIALFVAAGTLVVGWEALWKRFQNPDPFKHRREMLSSSLAMARERPWTGSGLGTFETAYPAFALFDVGLVVDHAHNDWAEWAAEGGLPFFLMLFSVAVWSVPHAVRSPWGLGVVAVFLHSLVDYPMQKPVVAAWLFVLLGAMAARSKEDAAPEGHAL